MQAQLSQYNWHQPLNLLYWLKHLLLPAVLVIGFLFLPKPWTTHLFSTGQVIELELFKAKPEPVRPIIEDPIDEHIKKPQDAPVEPPVEKTVEKPIERPIEKPSEAPKKPIPDTQVIEQKPQIDIIQPQFNVGDVLNMIENRIPVDIPTEFQARTGSIKDFYIPENEINNWLDDIPFLDESIDRPKIQMKFYAEGIEGAMEKFFDKITISKTFTTKYGTKIHCALIGVIAACGWK